MVFEAKKDTYGFHVDVNQGLINGYNAWKSGIELSVNPGNMDISITNGIIIWQSSSIPVIASTVTIPASDPTLGRRDLIAFDGTDYVVLAGVPVDETSSTAQPPNYDINAYTIIAMIHIEAGVTEIDAPDMIDYRTRAIDTNAGAGELENSFMYLGY